MFNQQKICIVFNGEIYNFKDLRECEELGYLFKSQSMPKLLLLHASFWH